MPPTILGPGAWRTCASPPRFRVGATGDELYSVELAEVPALMAGTAGRCPANYFFGGDADDAFATGQVWQLPEQAWRYLSRAHELYYRVVAVDQRGGIPVPSVADGDLDALPRFEVRECELRYVPEWM